MKNLKEIRDLINKIPNPYRSGWFYSPEKHGTRQDGSTYVLDAGVSYGTKGDDSDTYCLYEAYDQDVYRFIAAMNPEEILSLIDTAEALKLENARLRECIKEGVRCLFAGEPVPNTFLPGTEAAKLADAVRDSHGHFYAALYNPAPGKAGA